MSVISCDRKPWRGRAAKVTLQIGGSSDNSITRSITEVYQVVTNNAPDSAVVVLNSTLVPQIGISVHPDYPMALLVDISATQDQANPYQWYVVATFSTIQPRQPQDNPLQRPDVVRWTKRPIRQVVQWANNGGFEDSDGNVLIAGDGDPIAILNAASDLFDPPLEDDAYDLVATVTRNVPYVPQWAVEIPSFPAATNEAPVMFGGLSMNAATLLMYPPDISELKVENQIQYYTMTMEFAYRSIGWDWRIPNMGFNYVNSNGNKLPIKIYGAPASVAQMLDENGDQRIGGSPSDVTYAVFQRPRADYSVIRLPAR